MAVWFLSLIAIWVLVSVLLLVSLCKTAARLEKMEDSWSGPEESAAS